MNPTEEIRFLKERVTELEKRLNVTHKPDRLIFDKPIHGTPDMGLRILTSANEKLGFFGKVPVAQFSTSFNSTIDTTYGSDEANTLEGIRDALISYGLIHA